MDSHWRPKCSSCAHASTAGQEVAPSSSHAARTHHDGATNVVHLLLQHALGQAHLPVDLDLGNHCRGFVARLRQHLGQLWRRRVAVSLSRWVRIVVQIPGAWRRAGTRASACARVLLASKFRNRRHARGKRRSLPPPCRSSLRPGHGARLTQVAARKFIPRHALTVAGVNSDTMVRPQPLVQQATTQKQNGHFSYVRARAHMPTQRTPSTPPKCSTYTSSRPRVASGRSGPCFASSRVAATRRWIWKRLLEIHTCAKWDGVASGTRAQPRDPGALCGAQLSLPVHGAVPTRFRIRLSFDSAQVVEKRN